MRVLRCPHCLKLIEIEVKKRNYNSVLIEGFCLNSIKKELYSGRGRWEIPGDRLEKDVQFLLNSWAKKVIVYNVEGDIIEVISK